jgi:gamma-glutamyltranspeptidase/glutathione hydrolase
MLYYDAASGELHSLNGAYNTVRGEDDPATIPAVQISMGEGEFSMPEPSGRNVLVPGFMAGIQATHDQFGKLPFADLFEPSIWLADNGFPLAEAKVAMIARQSKRILRLPEGRSLFTKEDGSSYAAGDIFKQPALAETLRRTAERGAAYMYTGEWARKFVEAVQRNGGKMTLQDLADYEVIWGPPVRSQYKGFEIAANGLPAYGGVNIVEAMNLVEAAGIVAPVWESPESFFWMSQITRLGMLTYLAPAQTDALVPGLDLSLKSRTTNETARAIWKRMRAGTFPFTSPMTPTTDNHSAGVVAVDQWGNVAAVVHSINTLHWGSTGIFVDGVSVNDSAWVNLPLVMTVGPGERVPDPTNPLIVMKDGRPFLGSSSIGMGLHERTTQCLVDVLDHGMTPKQSIDAPAFMIPSLDPAAGPHPPAQVVEGQFGDAFLDQVRALGLGVNVKPASQRSLFQGYWIGVRIDPTTGIKSTGSPVVTISEPLPTSLAY